MVLLSLAVSFLLGVFLGYLLEPTATALWLFALGSVLGAATLAAFNRPLLPAFLALLFVLGALRSEAVEGGEVGGLERFHGQGGLNVQGLVASYPHTTQRSTSFSFSVDHVKLGDRWVESSGEVLVTLRPWGELTSLRDRPYVRYGDRLLLEGTVEAPRPFQDFDYPAYLARQGIRSVMSFPDGALLGEGHGNVLLRRVHRFRRSMADSLAMTVPEPQAALGQAVLLGLRDDLPQGLVEDFRATGTSHLLAISGLHVGTLLAISLMASQRLLGRRRQLYLAAPLVLVWLYALVAGMSPSVTRAAVMGTVYLSAHALGRPRSVLPALGFAAAVMVALSPAVLWSVSFQLSFASMAGIAVMAPPLSQRLEDAIDGRLGRANMAAPLLRAAAYNLAMTVAATVATLPLLAFHFQRVSLVGLPATLVTLPVLPLVLMTQAAAGAVGMASVWMAQPLGWLAWVPSAYLTGVVGLMARLPGIYLETGRIALALVWVYYGVIFAWYAREPIRGWLLRWQAAAGSGPPRLFAEMAVPWRIVIPICVAAVLLWVAALKAPDQRLHVVFADVGQGDLTFITTPGGRQVLVDGGPDPLGSVRLLGAMMPFRDLSIDLVVLTHPHSDHVAGLTGVLGRYDVSHILEREVAYESPEYLAWRRAVQREGAEVTQATAGQTIVLDGGVTIHVLAPPERLLRGTSSDADNSSVVLRLDYGDVSFLLAGDMFHEGEAALLGRGMAVDSDVLRVGHHGSRNSTSEAFLAGISPVAAVVSAGVDNRYGHPHPETLEALSRYVDDRRVFTTMDRGRIEFVTDGRLLEVKAER